MNRKILFSAVAFVAAVGFVGTASAQQALPIAGALASTTLSQPGDWRPGPGWNRDIEVHCASNDYHYNMCQIDTGRGSEVRIAQQLSKTRCVKDSNWGWNRAGVWVDQGCEAVFRVSRRWAGGPGPGHVGPGGPGPGPGGGFRPGPDFNRAISVRCASSDYHYNMCQVDTGRGSSVRITRQISKTRCVKNRNWGYNRAGVWVDQGCEAEFRIDRRWR